MSFRFKTALAGLALITLTTTLLVLGDPTTAPATQPAKFAEVAPPLQPRERYDVLSIRNMFIRGGSTGSTSIFGNTAPATQSTTAPTGASTPSTSESTWVLTGTAIGMGEPACIIENSQTGAALRVRVSDSIEVGKVIRIDADGIDLQTRSGIKRIAVGSSMDGAVSSTPLPAGWSQITPADPGSSGSASGGASSGGASDEAAILEKLKKRRAQELNGK